MTPYHAVLLDETGCEFGHSFAARSRGAAWEYVKEQFPESRCVQLEDPTDRAVREQAIYDRAAREIDGDEDYWDGED